MATALLLLLPISGTAAPSPSPSVCWCVEALAVTSMTGAESGVVALDMFVPMVVEVTTCSAGAASIGSGGCVTEGPAAKSSSWWRSISRIATARSSKLSLPSSSSPSDSLPTGPEDVMPENTIPSL